MKALKITHRGAQRIMVSFEYDKATIEKVRSIEGCLWSKTLKSWHLPYSQHSIEQLKLVLGIEMSTDSASTEHLKEPIIHEILKEECNNGLNVRIIVNKEAKEIIVTHPYNRLIYQRLSEVNGIKWDKKERRWILGGTNENYVKIKALVAQLNLENEPIKAEMDYRSETHPQIRLYIEALEMKNYSYRTIEAYYPHFKNFMNAHANVDVRSIQYGAIYAYIKRTVEQQRLSEAGIRHLISAIKFFYERLVGREKMLFYLEKKVEITPHLSIFTPLEMDSILDKIEDDSHKLVIFFRYAIGLSEEAMCDLSLANTKAIVASIEPDVAKKRIVEAIKGHYNRFKCEEYLFVKNDQSQLCADEFRAIIYNILQRYQIDDIYRKMLKDAFAQTSFGYGTLKVYTNSFLFFIKRLKFKHPATITDQEIRSFIVELSQNSEVAKNTISNYINSIKFFYKQILNREFADTLIFRPKKEQKLPEVLSLEEMYKITSSIKNLKHRCLIELTYSGGLRRSETLNLKVENIDFGRSVINIKKAKGKKDRTVMLAQSLKDTLRLYLESYKPEMYLFESPTKGKYSESSMRMILKHAVESIETNKHVSLHTLRHSFATHLLENGTDIRYIQSLLGHSDIKTTLRYTKVATSQIKKIQSPLDLMRERRDDNGLNDEKT